MYKQEGICDVKPLNIVEGKLDTVGIDAGGTLVKVAYQLDNKLYLKTFATTELHKLYKWLETNAPDAKLVVTGGRSMEIKAQITHAASIADEFLATVTGTRYLLQQKRSEEAFILVNVGTGTSIFSVTADHYERLFGSGIGGGLWIGLGSLLTEKADFKSLVSLASNGDQQKTDLLVKDIYRQGEAPLNGNLTAANFGKAHLNMEGTKADRMAALAQLIGETLIVFSYQAAVSKGVSSIVFVGSTIHENAPLKNVLAQFKGMLDYEPIFLEKGTHAGAIGALFLV
ncbi:type II pantothenate kinase [Virgibacillus sp. LDC-1]|uniref:type II pantothenate kinase n=1 Tax=Virgibacillus sp. LDC-1 TaxID=3039856 RepID=UPI0024DE5351|nr:type II pantothenate kinase [Virgibacillus sp. LDC-1]